MLSSHMCSVTSTCAPQDKALTIWLAAPRPIYIGRKFFKQGVVDLAWTPDGRSLLACSTDGTVACFQFDAAELGQAVSQEVLSSGLWLRVEERFRRRSWSVSGLCWGPDPCRGLGLGCDASLERTSVLNPAYAALTSCVLLTHVSHCCWLMSWPGMTVLHLQRVRHAKTVTVLAVAPGCASIDDGGVIALIAAAGDGRAHGGAVR